MLREFRSTIFFLVRFVSFYVVANLLYGLWVDSFEPRPDPATHVATQNAALVLEMLGWDTLVKNNPAKPKTHLIWNNRNIVSVFEGCNGINVAIVFMSFLVAFGPINRKLIWFTLVGLVIIYVVNVLRIVFLFVVTIRLPDYFYLAHKYLFTASIYVIVFTLWLWWLYATKPVKSE
jgi:exosortase family protein XrtF